MHYYGEASTDAAHDVHVRVRRDEQRAADLGPPRQGRRGLPRRQRSTNGIEEAWKRLETTRCGCCTTRGGASALSRSGKEALGGTRPRTSALITTELPPRAGTSGERRGPDRADVRRDIAIEDIQALDELGLRHRRALLMSSHLRWLAQDYRGNLLRLAGLREEFMTFLRTRSDLSPRLVERRRRQDRRALGRVGAAAGDAHRAGCAQRRRGGHVAGTG